MKRIPGFIFLIPIAVHAQAAAPDGQPGGPPQPVSHLLCLEDYPLDAVRHGRVGSATLLFRVNTGGHVAGVIVAASSGDDDLDDASVSCAKSWQFRPATLNGQAIEAPYTASIEWMINGPVWRMSLTFREPLDACMSGEQAANGNSYRRADRTVVSYSLRDGDVSAASIKRSSGNAALDQKAIACVSAWRFEPLTVDPTVSVTAQLLQSPKDAPESYTRTPKSLKVWRVTETAIAKFDWPEMAGP